MTVGSEEDRKFVDGAAVGAYSKAKQSGGRMSADACGMSKKGKGDNERDMKKEEQGEKEEAVERAINIR